MKKTKKPTPTNTTNGAWAAIQKVFGPGGPPYARTIDGVMLVIDADRNGWSRRGVTQVLCSMYGRGILERVGPGKYTRAIDRSRGDVLPLDPVPKPIDPEPWPETAPRPATPPLVANALTVTKTRWSLDVLKSFTDEELSREVVWRLAAGTLDAGCVKVLVETFAKKVYLEFAQKGAK